MRRVYPHYERSENSDIIVHTSCESCKIYSTRDEENLLKTRSSFGNIESQSRLILCNKRLFVQNQPPSSIEKKSIISKQKLITITNFHSFFFLLYYSDFCVCTIRLRSNPLHEAPVCSIEAV